MTLPFNPNSQVPPPPQKLFSDFLNSLPRGSVTQQEPPPQENLLKRILNTVTKVTNPQLSAGSTAHRIMQESGDAQRKSWEAFLMNPQDPAGLDAVVDLIVPMGTIGKAMSSVAANPASKDFLETLYSRLEAALVGGPGKAPAKQWKSYLEKSAPKGEIAHTGLYDFLDQNPDAVIPKHVLMKEAKKNPVELKQTIFDAISSPYGVGMSPKFPAEFTPNINTLQESVLSANLPLDKSVRELLEQRQRGRALKDAYDQAYRDYTALADLPWQERDSKKAEELRNIWAEAGKKLDDFRRSTPDWFSIINDDLPQQRPDHFNQVPNQVGWTSSMMGELDGKPALGIYEVQSDAHQAARTEGRRTASGGVDPKEAARLQGRIDAAVKNLRSLGNAEARVKAGEISYKDLYDAQSKVTDAESYLSNYLHRQQGVLPLPFQGDSEWPELMLKQALHRAATEGAENIVFPAGKEISEAVGMPKEGRKFYDKDLPNQLAEYLKKQFGVKVEPQFLSKPPKPEKLANVMSNYAQGFGLTPLNPSYAPMVYNSNIIGPQPEGMKRFAVDLMDHAPYEATGVVASPGRINKLFEKALTEKELYESQYPHSALPPIPEHVLNAMKTDLNLISQKMFTAPQPNGTIVPFPAEARQKILDNGQRLWMALAAAGIPTFMASQQKSDTTKKKQQ